MFLFDSNELPSVSSLWKSVPNVLYWKVLIFEGFVLESLYSNDSY